MLFTTSVLPGFVKSKLNKKPHRFLASYLLATGSQRLQLPLWDTNTRVCRTQERTKLTS
jgi:hypothetical protein